MAYLEFKLKEYWLSPGTRINPRPKWMCDIQLTAYQTTSYRDKESGVVKKKRRQICNFITRVVEDSNRDIVDEFNGIWERMPSYERNVRESVIHQFWLTSRQTTLADKLVEWNISGEELKSKFLKRITDYQDSFPRRLKERIKLEARRKEYERQRLEELKKDPEAYREYMQIMGSLGAM